MLLGGTNAFAGFPGVDLFQQFFNLIPSAQLNKYLIITIAWLPCFFLGHFCYRLINPYQATIKTFLPDAISGSVWTVGILLCIALLIFTWLGRGSILGGYGSYDVAARGKFSSLLVLFNFFLAFRFVEQKGPSFFILTGTLLTAIILLSMGGRMYVFQTLVLVLIYKTSIAKKRWSAPQILLALMLGFVLGSISGLWRMGADFSFKRALYFVFAEPLFTWFSTSSFLTSNEINYFNFPANFITSFLNLVPNTFFSLQPYIISTQSMAANYQNPLGADSIWSTFVINFGSIGSCVFIFLCGFLLNHLRFLGTKRRFWAAYYLMVCSILPFQFFRDGFYIMNKQLFFNFLILPALILFVLKTLLYSQRIYIRQLRSRPEPSQIPL